MITAARIRQEIWQNMPRQEWDILVIGGGITGAGIALDAASRGLKVALVDMHDFASGTSSRSTKLIHGGLRYLKNFEWGLVRETGIERAIAYKTAPHLVRPEPMLLPVLNGGSMSRNAISLGVLFYDFLADVPRKQRRIMLDKLECLAKEPLLNKDLVKGAALYHEYRTDDARLTIEVLKTARNHGACVLNYAKAEKPIFENGKIVGFSIQDMLSEQKMELKAKVIINAAGPWVDQVRKAAQSLNDKRLVWSKGVHLVFSKKKLNVNQACYVDVLPQKGRMIFIIPRDESTYVGTTDTFFPGPDNPDVTLEDVHYLLDALNAVLDIPKLEVKDIQSSWCGLRPLIHHAGKPSSELSRKDEIFVSEKGLITIAGGKLTGYRKMAQRTVDKAIELGRLPKSKSHTAQIVLQGGHINGSLDAYIYQKAEECSQIPFEYKQVERLVFKYGSEIDKIIEMAYTLYNADRSLTAPLLPAEIQYAIEQEFVQCPADFYIRRTGMLYFYRNEIPMHQKLYGSFMQERLGLQTDQFTEKQAEMKQTFHDALSFVS